MSKNLDKFMKIKEKSIDFCKINSIEKAKLENGKTVEFAGMTSSGSFGYKEKPNSRIIYTWGGSEINYMIRWGNKGETYLKIIKIFC